MALMSIADTKCMISNQFGIELVREEIRWTGSALYPTKDVLNGLSCETCTTLTT